MEKSYIFIQLKKESYEHNILLRKLVNLHIIIFKDLMLYVYLKNNVTVHKTHNFIFFNHLSFITRSNR